VPVFPQDEGLEKPGSAFGDSLAGQPEIQEKITALRGFSALHASLPLPGLRSSGKGANRTILDCVFHLFGRDKWSFCRRGGRGRRQPLRAVRIKRCQGRFHRLQMRKGLES
jgi:hypothetical protein